MKNIKPINPENYQTYTAWLGRQVTQEARLAAYPCPCCGVLLHTHCPLNNEVSDSLSTCPVCDKTFFKVVSTNNDGVSTVGTTPLKMLDIA